MKIYTEKDLREFDFWSGANDTRELLTDEEMLTIEDILIDVYPDGMNKTELNDFFCFETDTIAEWLGYEDFEALYEERHKGE